MTFMSETGSSGYPASPPAPPGPLRMTPGRWLVLGLALPVAIALIGWTGFSLVSLVARGTYSFSYPVPVRNGQVNVNVNAGSVTMRQDPGTTARMTGTVQYGLFRPDIALNPVVGGNTLGISCPAIASNCKVNATLDVPAQTAVGLNSGGGDVEVSGLADTLSLGTGGGNLTASDVTGDMTVDTGGGDMTANGLAGHLQLSTGGGNINAGNLTGDMQVLTGGGDLSGNGFTGNLTFSTDGGSINVSAADSNQVTVQSGGGDVTLMFSRPPANLHITTYGGTVNLVLPHGTTYDISTPGSNGGNINIQPGLASPASQHTISVNSGGGDITITAAS